VERVRARYLRGMSPPPDPSGLQIATSLRIMRIAFTGAVLGFAVLAQRMVARDGPLGAENAELLRWANIAVLVVAGATILLLQRRHEREPDPRRRQPLNVFAWATGEMAAFLGIVHWMMVGNPLPFYVGLATMLAAFVLVPIRE
jgi:hypothetical protein